MGNTKKIVISVVCLVLAAVMFLIFNKPKEVYTAEGTVLLQCVNEGCGATFEVPRREFEEQIHKKIMERGDGEHLFTCPECGQETCHRAMKCPECGAVFVPDYYSDDYFDRCPKCGYSEMEQKQGEPEK